MQPASVVVALVLPVVLSPLPAGPQAPVVEVRAGAMFEHASAFAESLEGQPCPGFESSEPSRLGQAIARLAARLGVDAPAPPDGIPPALAKVGAYLAECAAEALQRQARAWPRLRRPDLPPLTSWEDAVDVIGQQLPTTGSPMSPSELVVKPTVPPGAETDPDLLAAGRMLDGAARMVAVSLAEGDQLPEGCWSMAANADFDLLQLCSGDEFSIRRDAVVAVIVGNRADVRNNAGGAVGPLTTIPHPYLGPPASVAVFVGSEHRFNTTRDYVQGTGVIGGVGVLHVHGEHNFMKAGWSAQGWGDRGVGILRITGGGNTLETGNGHGLGLLGGLGLAAVGAGSNQVRSLAGGFGVLGVGVFSIGGGNNTLLTGGQGGSAAGLGLTAIAGGGNRLAGGAHGWNLLGGAGILAIEGGGNELSGGLWHGLGVVGQGVVAIAGGGNYLEANEQAFGGLGGQGVIMVEGGGNAFVAQEAQGKGQLGLGVLAVRGSGNRFSPAAMDALPAGLGRYAGPHGDVGWVVELTPGPH